MAIYSQVEKLSGSFDCNTIGATVYLYGRLKDLSSRKHPLFCYSILKPSSHKHVFHREYGHISRLL